MKFRLLGPLEVVDDDGGALPLGGPRPRALLAQLLLHPNEVVSTDRLIDGIWGETPPASAANALQVHVHALRTVLGADRITTRPPGYLLRVDEGELDTERFERLLADDDPRGAIALWRGPALADLANEPFARSEAARLDDARLGALEARIDLDLADGRHATLTAELDALVADHPHRERLRGQQMLALYRSGRQADALAAYRDARHALDELGLQPSADLRLLERRILEHDEGLGAPSRVAKGAGPGRENALVGREREIAAVVALLRRSDVRLVTLTGTGGTGKTRLAQAAADEAGGGVFVDLAPLTDPGLVLAAIARALGIDEEPTTPLLDAVASRLAESPPLLVLDNLEHLEPSFVTIGRLLEAAPRLGILATSRVPLHLAGEHEYRVPPLAVPAAQETSATELATCASVRLYVDRAQAAVPAFELSESNAASVSRICRALDGLPLAIELAAARIRVLGPEGTARRLGERLAFLTRTAHDLPERQRSVRGAIDWSYRLLDEEAKATFRALGVFSGAVGLDAIDEVVGPPASPEVMETLLDASLVLHSVDRSGEPRFGLLETLREYAAAELDATGELERLRRSHATYYLAMVEDVEAARGPGGPFTSDALDQLDDCHAEILGALAYVTESDMDSMIRLTVALREYWRVRGLFEEATLHLERAVERLPEPPPPSARFALHGAAFFAYMRANWEPARRHGERALTAHVEAGDRLWAARTQQLLAAIANAVGDVPRARGFTREAAAYFRETENWYGLALVLGSISESSRKLGELDAAREAISEAISLRALHGDESLYAFALVVLAGIAAECGDHDEAATLVTESFPIAIERDDLESIPPNLFIAARIAAAFGDPERAALLLGAAERALRRLGDGRYEMERAEYFDPVDAEAAALLGTQRTAELRASGLLLEPADAAELVAALSSRATLTDQRD